jgi:putative membrane protein
MCATVSRRSRVSPMMSDPQRLHPAAILILAIRVARQLLLPLLAPVVLSLFGRGLSALDLGFLLLIGGALGLLLILSIGWGILYWRRYTFRVTNNELQIEQGVVFHKRRTIPRERIQAIDFVEGIMHRLFGLVAVRVQTAGGPGPGFSLIGIARSDADLLRRELSIRPGSAPIADETEVEGESPIPEPIRVLPMSQLVLAAITSGGIGIALPLIASGMSILNNAMREVDLFDVVTAVFGGTSWWSVALFVLLAAWVLSIAGTILAHAGFTIRRVDDNLQIERGLIEKRRATVPLNRIQAIRIIDGVLRQPFGYVMLKVESAGYGQESGESTVLYPMIRRSEVQDFLNDTVPEFACFPNEFSRPPRRAARRYITRMLIVGLLVTAIVAGIFYPLGLWAFATLPLFGVFGWLRYRDAGWALDGEILILRYRSLARSTAIVPKRRIQSSDVTQSILQKRASLGNISTTVASGSSGSTFTVLHLDKTIADQLFTWTGRWGRREETIP